MHSLALAQIAGPEEDAGPPQERDASGHRLCRRQAVNGLTRELNRLGRIAQNPQCPRQYDPRPFVMKIKAAAFDGVERGRLRERRLQVSAGLDLISDQMMRDAKHRMRGGGPDWIVPFPWR